MQIAGISAAAPTTRPRDRDDRRATEEEIPKRLHFSPTHVILDLSNKALEEIGQEPISKDQPIETLLFIYDGTGSLIYDEPEQQAPSNRRTPDIEDTPAETPAPKFIAFDGMLDASSRL